ncbi:hypothetical protein BH24ACT4_BH24ACT4_20610 [soil metagenome]
MTASPAPGPGEPAVHVRGLVKRYGDFAAVGFHAELYGVPRDILLLAPVVGVSMTPLLALVILGEVFLLSFTLTSLGLVVVALVAVFGVVFLAVAVRQFKTVE